MRRSLALIGLTVLVTGSVRAAVDDKATIGDPAAPRGAPLVLGGHRARVALSCDGEKHAKALIDPQPDGRFVLDLDNPMHFVRGYRLLAGGKAEPIEDKADTYARITIKPRPAGENLDLDMAVEVRHVSGWERDGTGPYAVDVPRFASCLFAGSGIARRSGAGWSYDAGPEPRQVRLSVDIVPNP